MTYAIDKYKSTQLATLTTDKLTLAVDKFVRGMFTELEESSQANKDAQFRLEKYSGTDEDIIKVLRKNAREASSALKTAIKNINGYIDEQRELMSSKRVSPDMVYTWAIVPTGKDERGVETCRLVKRNLPFYKGDESGTSVKVVIPSEKLVEHEEHRGKYNDGHMLMLESICSVDRSELLGEY